MNASMILRICLLLFLEVGGERVFRPVDTKCIPICSNQREKGWAFNCDGDNTTCDWQCSAQRKACPEGLTYHCAADYADFELHTGYVNYLEECALEKPCKRGDEPSITLYVNGKKLPPNAAKINCMPCSNKYFYNSQDGRLSSSYSRCFQEKFNKCIPEDNKIDCGESWLKRTESDGYCRCDARRGFAPENENIDTMCFYTDENCMSKKCPSKQELALNYTCISNCPDGYHRTDDSDICVEGASATAKTKPPTAASSTTDQTYSQATIASTTEKEKVEVSSKKTVFKQIVLGAVLGAVGLMVVGLGAWILIMFCRHKKRILEEYHKKGCKKAARLMVEKAFCQNSSCCKAVETSGEAGSTHSGESHQELEEEDRSLLSHVEQGGTGVPWKRKVPEDRELWYVASLIGENWKGLGSDLGLDHTRIHQIEYDNHKTGHIDVVHRMLIELRNSRSYSTLNDLKEAIIRSKVGFNWGSEKIQELFEERDQHADSNDTTGGGDRNAIPNDTKTNNTIDIEADVHTAGSSGVRTSSISSTSSTASRGGTAETQL